MQANLPLEKKCRRRVIGRAFPKTLRCEEEAIIIITMFDVHVLYIPLLTHTHTHAYGYTNGDRYKGNREGGKKSEGKIKENHIYILLLLH